ncbi:hypothetical protein ZOSMA_205G00330 [Zostera marina]|uniref:Transcription factor CBF/NF-Y/archaeal histone domain-containing protein n=1 Tax=Zostera marina TaxID=29655 RepID=A0A0K9PLK3_ZOSMR|nr:hypothetical protein ZOSMA_205G00330 [Zostera marina]
MAESGETSEGLNNGIEGSSVTNNPTIATGITSNSNPGRDASSNDRFLPIANVSRIMKRALPLNAKISKEAKETLQECVSEFVSYITGEASEKCHREKRKTINGDDLLWSMNRLDFDAYTIPLKKYRESEGERSNISPSHQTQQQRQPPIAQQPQNKRMCMDINDASSSGAGLGIDNDIYAIPTGRNCNDYGNGYTGIMDPTAHYTYPTVGGTNYSISNVVGGNYNMSESSLYGGLDPRIYRSNNEVGSLTNGEERFPTIREGFDNRTEEAGDLMAMFSSKIDEANENDGMGGDISSAIYQNYLYPDTLPPQLPSPGK